METAQELNLRPLTVKSNIARIVQNGLANVVQVSNSWKGGGTEYEIPKWVAQRLNESHATRTQMDSDSAENTPVVVVGFKEPTSSTTTDGDHKLALMMSPLEARLDLSGRFKIGVRDLAEALHKSELPIDKFEMSVEHVAFHAGSDGGTGLRNPGRWMVKQLSAGYVHEPAGFESWADKQERAMLEDVQCRVQRQRDLQRQRLDAEFEEHLLALSKADK